MKMQRFWIEIVIIGTAVACVLALLIAALGATGAAVGAQSRQTYEGVVTCSRCGARHSAELGKTAADCTRICVHGGSRFALVDGDKTYLLQGDLSALKRAAGQRTSIVGTTTGTTIRVSSIGAIR